MYRIAKRGAGPVRGTSTCHVLWAWVGACTMLFSRDAETTRSNILTHDISDTCGPLVAQGGCPGEAATFPTRP